MQHGNNVETLGFTQVAPKGGERPQALDADQINALIHETVHQTVNMLSNTIAQASEFGANRALGSVNANVLGTFRAIGTVLAAKLLLLLALAGAFALAWTAMGNPSWPSIIILISYVLLTVLPLVWLDRNGRRSHHE